MLTGGSSCPFGALIPSKEDLSVVEKGDIVEEEMISAIGWSTSIYWKDVDTISDLQLL